MQRRAFLLGLGSVLAAPLVVRTPGLLMPVKAAPAGELPFDATNIQEYLQRLKDCRGIYDFVVVCDERNNSPSAVADGLMNVDIMLRTVPGRELRVYNPPSQAAFETTVQAHLHAIENYLV